VSFCIYFFFLIIYFILRVTLHFQVTDATCHWANDLQQTEYISKSSLHFTTNSKSKFDIFHTPQVYALVMASHLGTHGISLAQSLAILTKYFIVSLFPSSEISFHLTLNNLCRKI
jgi:hypothetical protein